MTDPLRVLLAESRLGFANRRTAAEAAGLALAEGTDSPSLRVLAGLEPSDDATWERWLARVQSELGLATPSAPDAVLLLSIEAARKILNGQLAPEVGAGQIWNLSLELAPDQRLPELDTFVYGASEWDARPQDRHAFEAGIRAAAELLAAREPER